MSTTGEVRMYNEERGFGFIRPDDAIEDIFFHVRAIVGTSTLSRGDVVEYDTELDHTRNKICAINVRAI